MLSEAAHLAAKLQRELLRSSSNNGTRHRAPQEPLLGGIATGVPPTVQLDRSTSFALTQLVRDALSVDVLGLASQTTISDTFGPQMRDALSYALSEISKSLEVAAPELRKVRAVSSVPQTVQAACALLESVDAAVRAVNNKLLHIRFDAASPGPHMHSPAKTVELGEPINRPRTDDASFRDAVAGSNERHHDAELRALKSELCSMKEREGTLLKKIRDLEIDCRVKAHTVASTTASAQAVFDENTILRQIAEHNQSLLREVDALHRCVAENEALRMELGAKQKTIDALTSRAEAMNAEEHVRRRGGVE